MINIIKRIKDIIHLKISTIKLERQIRAHEHSLLQKTHVIKKLQAHIINKDTQISVLKDAYKNKP